MDGRLPIIAARRLPVSDGVVALRSWHVDFWVWIIWVTFQVSGLPSSSSSLLPRCVRRSYMYHTAKPARPFVTNVASSNAHPTGLIRYMGENHPLYPNKPASPHPTSSDPHRMVGNCHASEYIAYIPIAWPDQCLLERHYMIRLFQRPRLYDVTVWGRVYRVYMRTK